jgi:hypothetical protein
MLQMYDDRDKFLVAASLVILLLVSAALLMPVSQVRPRGRSSRG